MSPSICNTFLTNRKGILTRVYDSGIPIPVWGLFFTIGDYVRTTSNVWIPRSMSPKDLSYLAEVAVNGKIPLVKELYAQAGLTLTVVLVPGLPVQAESGLAIAAVRYVHICLLPISHLPPPFTLTLLIYQTAATKRLLALISPVVSVIHTKYLLVHLKNKSIFIFKKDKCSYSYRGHSCMLSSVTKVPLLVGLMKTVVVYYYLLFVGCVAVSG